MRVCVKKKGLVMLAVVLPFQATLKFVVDIKVHCGDGLPSMPPLIRLSAERAKGGGGGEGHPMTLDPTATLLMTSAISLSICLSKCYSLSRTTF